MKWRWRATSFNARLAADWLRQRQRQQRQQRQRQQRQRQQRRRRRRRRQKRFDFDQQRPNQRLFGGERFYGQWRATGADLALRTGWPCADGSAPATRRRDRTPGRWQRGTWNRSTLTRLSRPLLCVQGGDQGTAAGAPGLRRWWCPARGFGCCRLSRPRPVSFLAVVCLPPLKERSRAPRGAQISPAAARSEHQGKLAS
jgi:hypothetical protein